MCIDNSSTINEAALEFKNTKGISRFKMPQIEKSNVPDFVSWLRGKGIKTELELIRVSELKPTQSKYNPDKVETMKKEVSIDVLTSDVIVSNDNYILDGHHRYQALVELSKNHQMKTIKVDLIIDELLSMANKYPKSFTKGINEGIMSFKQFIM